MTPPKVQAEDVVLAAAEHFGLRPQALTGRATPLRLAWRRIAAMHAAREFGLSAKAIGRAFGGRDPTTIIHASKTVETWTSGERWPGFDAAAAIAAIAERAEARAAERERA